MSEFIEIMSTIGTILKFGWPVIILFILVGIKLKQKNYPVDVVILEKRNSNMVKTNDRAGKYVDKYSKMQGWRMLKSKDNIPIANLDWMLVNNEKPTNLFEWISKKLRPTAGTIFLFRYGSKQYKPIKIMENEEEKVEYVEVKDKQGNAVVEPRYIQYDPRGHFGKLDFKVIDWDDVNFTMQEIRVSTERRRKQSEFWKQMLIPAMMIGGAVIIAIVIIKYGFDYSQTFKCQAQPTQTNTPAEQPKIPVISDVMPGE